MRKGKGCRSLIERLKLESELKSILSALSRRFLQTFTTRSAKTLDLTKLLQKCVKI